jgi:hypothetical protein
MKSLGAAVCDRIYQSDILTTKPEHNQVTEGTFWFRMRETERILGFSQQPIVTVSDFVLR